MADDKTHGAGKKDETRELKFNAAQFFTTALAEYLQIYVENPRNKIPGLDTVIRQIREMAGSHYVLAGLDGMLKTVFRNAPGLSDNVRDLGEELVDMFFDRARYFPTNGTKQQAEDDFRIGRVKADAVLEAWKKKYDAKPSFAAIEMKLATEDPATHSIFIDWLHDMKRWMPKSNARWEMVVDKIEGIPRIKLTLARTATLEDYPTLDPKDQPEDLSTLPADFHKRWAVTQARLDYLDRVFPATLLDTGKALLQGRETPGTAAIAKRIATFTAEADAFADRQKAAVAKSDANNGIKKYLLSFPVVVGICIVIFVALAGLLLTSAN